MRRAGAASVASQVGPVRLFHITRVYSTDNVEKKKNILCTIGTDNNVKDVPIVLIINYFSCILEKYLLNFNCSIKGCDIENKICLGDKLYQLERLLVFVSI